MSKLNPQILINWAESHNVFICDEAYEFLPLQDDLETAYKDANLQFKLWAVNQIIQPVREGEFEPFFKALLDYRDSAAMCGLIEWLVDPSRQAWNFEMYTRRWHEEEVNAIVVEHFPWEVMEKYFQIRLSEPIPQPEPEEEDYEEDYD